MRRVSMMFGNWEIRPSNRPNASSPGISMVWDINAVLLDVPRAPVLRVAQAIHQVQQVFK
ncbi:hypothetical protein LUW10_21835 [Pseudomonas veronii]|nr:hypothetical protein [Pseudomonas veronii]UHH33313.1 hypothetical protein LUW10_21835 [Pseudomonas veronii]